MQLNLPDAHGFKIEMGIGPHPKGNGKALNVWLTPATVANQEKMRRAGKSAIQGALPVGPAAITLIENDPLDERVEKIVRRALAEPLRLARIVNEVR